MLSLARLRELGAAFKKPQEIIGAAVAAVPNRPSHPKDATLQQHASGGGGGAGAVAKGSGEADFGPGVGRVWKMAAKPGAQRILAAMSMATLWGHRVRLINSVSLDVCV